MLVVSVAFSILLYVDKGLTGSDNMDNMDNMDAFAWFNRAKDQVDESRPESVSMDVERTRQYSTV